MPFRCKCGRTFEKLDTFGSHTSSCAPFHRRRISTSDIMMVNTIAAAANKEQEDNLVATEKKKRPLSIQTDSKVLTLNNIARHRYILMSPLSKSFINNDIKERESDDSNSSNSNNDDDFFSIHHHQKPTATTSYDGRLNSADTAPHSAPAYDGRSSMYYGFMMPTALSIQNTFEGVQRRRSMSYATTSGAGTPAAANTSTAGV